MNAAAEPRASRPLANSLVGRTLASDVLHRLRNDIVECQFQPGERLRFQTLRLRYAVSFSTLREALAHLVKEGLVVAEGQRGFRVAPASLEDFCDLIEVQVMVERRAIGLSIPRGDTAWAEAIRLGHAAMEEARAAGGADYSNTAEWATLHAQFHSALVAACGSPTLLEIRAMLRERYMRYRRIAVLRGHFGPPNEDTHRAIMEAALRRDTPETQALVERQMRAVAKAMLDQDGGAPLFAA